MKKNAEMSFVLSSTWLSILLHVVPPLALVAMTANVVVHWADKSTHIGAMLCPAAAVAVFWLLMARLVAWRVRSSADGLVVRSLLPPRTLNIPVADLRSARSQSWGRGFLVTLNFVVNGRPESLAFFSTSPETGTILDDMCPPPTERPNADNDMP